MKLKDLYKKEIIKKMQEEFGYKNKMAVPKIEKAVLNVGFGRHAKDKAYIKNVENTLTAITGQKCVLTKAKKSVSAFKVREGMTIGAMVTLRGEKMYDFVEKLVNVSFPRIRDFRGISKKSVDKTGNIAIGFKEQIAFGEIKAEMAENIHGLEVSIATSAKTKEEGLELFKLLGFPFKKK